MDRESWTQLNRLLDEALDLLPEDREGWLDSLGPDNEPVKARLRALLAHRSSIHASGFLESVPSLTAVSVSTSGFNTRVGKVSPEDDRDGAAVGAYRLLRCIGGGGMGTVWLAERADGLLQREVALKFPRAAWQRADLVARMERERDILSTLEHPNIARLYDAGVTAAGRPYLALEYVNGQAIDEYCATRALDIRARVRLFLQVVQAVAYAHGRLVVHRDLKPSNILVTHDGQVRLLDFGIAKLLDDGDDRRSGETAFGVRPHTPEYASPEQISGEPLSIASDVYSLGVVLYELLAGTRPAPLPRSVSGVFEASMLETDPAPPSAATADVSRRRMVRGDLDTIVLKALKKRPVERYATVNALGEDLQRWLDGRPVIARPDSTRYRLSKFLRRHAIAVGAITAVVASLAAFGIVSARQARVLAEQRRVAQIERDTSDQVVRVLIDLFQTTNPSIHPDGDRMPVGEFLAGAQERSLELLRATPAVRARLQQVFGLIRQTRGQYREARAVLDAALAEQERILGADHPDTLESLEAVAELAAALGETERARALLEESLRRHTRVFGDAHERTSRVLHALAPVVAVTDLDEGGRLLMRAVDIRRATLRPDDPLRAEALGSLGGYYTRRREYQRAKGAYEEALAVFPTAQARRHPRAITILNDFANLFSVLGRYAEAEALQREAIDVGRQVLGPDTASVANLLNSLGVTQCNLGRPEEAERSFRAAYDSHRSLMGERHWRTVNVARNVGLALSLQQHHAEALTWMDKVIAVVDAPEVANDPARRAGSFHMRAQRAHVLFRLNRRQEGLAEASAAVAGLERLPASETARNLASSRLLLGRMLNESGRPGDAEATLEAALRGFESLASNHPQRAEVVCELARARLLQHSRAEDRRKLRECLPIYRSWGLAEPQVVVSLERLLDGGPS
jgi:eukaryotic-like serine/threonine-protein kinase